MKKLISFLIGLVVLAPIFSVAQANFPKQATLIYPATERKVIVEVGSQQASLLLGFGYQLYKEGSGLIGFTVATDYTTTLTQGITSSASSIPVSSVKTKDGTTLTMAILGSKAYFNIEPGTSREEIIVCTGITGSQWTGCTRGLAFSGNSEVAVVANQKAHNAGAQFIMSNVHYVYQNFVDLDSNQTVGGIKNFTNNPTTSTTTPTNSNQIVTKSYVDGVAISGAPNASQYVKGISKLSTDPASSTNPITVGDNDTRVPTQNENNALVGTSGQGASSTNKYVDNADTTGTGTIYRASVIDARYKFGGSGADGMLNVTSGTTTIDLASANLVIKNYTSINVASGTILTFTNPAANGTVIIFKSQGDVTIAGTVTISALGANSATAGYGVFYASPAAGGVGNNNVSNGGSPANLTYLASHLSAKTLIIATGSGGGVGQTASGAGGAGGKGAGSIYFETRGNLSITGNLNAVGANGAVGTIGVGSSGGGGGGGGAGGAFIFLYNGTLTDSKTLNLFGGNGGNGGAATANSGGAGSQGGGGGALVNGGGAGGVYIGSNGSTGNSGSTGGGTYGGTGGTGGAAATASGGSGGGGGASGYILINKNTEF